VDIENSGAQSPESQGTPSPSTDSESVKAEPTTVGFGPFALPAARVARWEWLVLGGTCLACMAYWLLHYHQFYLPSPDTYSFVRAARSLGSGELPESFKRMPLLPLMMGLLGKSLTGDAPEVRAALILNLIFSAGSLVFLYFLARRMIGGAAILPVLLAAGARECHEMAGQALVEPIMGFAILFSLWLFFKKSRWQYLALFFAALTRYECSALIAIFFVLNWIYERKPWQHLTLAALASSGFLVWMLLSVLRGASEAGNPYLEQMHSQGWQLSPAFAWTFVNESFSGWGAAIWGVLAALGAWLSWRNCRRESAAVLAFALLYVLAHVAFGVNRERYVYPVRWIPPLYLGLCAGVLLNAAGRKLGSNWSALRGRLLAAVCALAALGSGAYALSKLLPAQGVAPRWAYLALPAALLAAGAVYSGLMIRKPIRTWLAVGLVLAAVIAPQISRGVAAHARETRPRKYESYGSYLTGRWLRGRLRSEERALAPNHLITARSAAIPREKVISFLSMESRDLAALRAEMLRKSITYLVYQHYRMPEKTDPRYSLFVRRNRPELLKHFRKGRPVPGFEHVETLELPPEARSGNVQIYRLTPAR
jgi:hypothetical protein